MGNSHVTWTKNWWIMKSYQWLKFGDIKGETEGTVVAAEDQVINTNYFKNNGRKKLTVNAGYINNIKKLLIT
jgi:hypothetical protein